MHHDSPSATPLLVFADDWGRHPSSCQHLVRHLLDRHPVLWVNTIGTRTPRLEWTTLTRGLEKIRHWFRKAPPTETHPANLRVANPKMWPWFGSPFARRLNRRLLVRQLTPLLQSLPAPPVAISTLPVVSDLIGALPVQRWVYYCVDDFGQWPGLDQTALLAMDEDLIQKADTLVAVSENLQARIASRGRTSQLLTHGVDLDFWRPTGPKPPIPSINGLQPPLVVFWGVADRRMDMDFVRRLSRDLEKGSIILVGPWSNPDPELLRLPRVVHIPPLSFESLPYVAQAASVLIMPYADLPVTRAMQPLKLKEYLATGKPVVVADLPANRPWSDCLDVVSSAEAFSQMVRQRIAIGVPDHQVQARRRLEGESWKNKAHQFAQWILAEEKQPDVARSM